MDTGFYMTDMNSYLFKHFFQNLDLPYEASQHESRNPLESWRHNTYCSHSSNNIFRAKQTDGVHSCLDSFCIHGFLLPDWWPHQCKRTQSVLLFDPYLRVGKK